MTTQFRRVARFARATAVVLATALAWALGNSTSARAATLDRARLATGDVSGTVSDSASGQPLAGVEVTVTQTGRTIANALSDDFGRYTVHNLQPGNYDISVHFIGYRPLTRGITVPVGGDVPRTDFKLVTVAVSLTAMEVHAAVPVALDTRTGDQVFKENEYHGAPTNTTSQILQQSMAGAVRAPTGEVHIRGQHAEYTYYIDGVPVPAGISGSLNELFDPQVVNQISFQTGGWDAEYGNKNAAVVNVQTRIPTGGFHADGSGYGGSSGAKGGSLNLSTNEGRLGVFVSGSWSGTDMRREPIMFDTTNFTPINVHNHGEDAFAFGKLQYSIGTRDVMNLDINVTQTRFQIPFDTTGGVLQDDQERDRNGFANLAWRHQFGDSTDVTRERGELFAGAFVRYGSLDYYPGPSDQPQFIFFPDTTPYNLREARNFTTSGLKIDYLFRPTHALETKIGVLAQATTGHEHFQTTNAQGLAGPGSNSGLTGSDVGEYAQIAWTPVEKFELRTGMRYDAHTAPFAGTRTQLSPRVRFNFYPTPQTSFYLYYGRLFIPTNVEDLRAITSVAQGGTTAEPTIPERDNFYEGGLIHRFGEGGLVGKLSAYHKESTPGIDDNTIPGSAIVTSVNVAQIHITGLEGVLEVRPNGPFSGYLNVALNHAYGHGPITGGFFPAETPQGNFDLDHDQRLSIVGNGTWSANRWFVSGTTIYGSGLPNGRDPSEDPSAYGTGLFDWNGAFKVNPSTIVNASAGYSFISARGVVRPQLYIENLFDRHYLLKGAFFNGASVGRPRSIQLRMNVSM